MAKPDEVNVETHELHEILFYRKEHSAAIAATKTERGHSCPLRGDHRQLLQLPRTACSQYGCGQECPRAGKSSLLESMLTNSTAESTKFF